MEQQQGQQGPRVQGPARERAPAAPACPSCGETNEPGARFCETCGYDLGAAASANGADPSGVPAPPIGAGADSERPTPIWFLIAILWVVLMVAGLIWLFSRAIAL